MIPIQMLIIILYLMYIYWIYHYVCIFIQVGNHTHNFFCHIDESIICKYGIWIKIHFAKILEQCNKWSTLQLTIRKDVECIGKMWV